MPKVWGDDWFIERFAQHALNAKADPHTESWQFCCKDTERSLVREPHKVLNPERCPDCVLANNRATNAHRPRGSPHETPPTYLFNHISCRTRPERQIFFGCLTATPYRFHSLFYSLLFSLIHAIHRYGEV